MAFGASETSKVTVGWDVCSVRACVLLLPPIYKTARDPKLTIFNNGSFHSTKHLWTYRAIKGKEI